MFQKEIFCSMSYLHVSRDPTQKQLIQIITKINEQLISNVNLELFREEVNFFCC